MAWTNGPSRITTTEYRRLRAQAARDLPNHCAQCGTQHNLELDHIVPVKEGGTDTMNNVQWLCQTCHKPKTANESRRGIQRRKARLRLPVEKHPGLR